MIIEDGIKVRNYKCFGDEYQGFDKIYPINIIIGKNNSGKSTLLDIVNYSINPNIDFLKSTRKGKRISIVLSRTIPDSLSQTIRSVHKYDLKDKRVHITFDSSNTKNLIEIASFKNDTVINDSVLQNLLASFVQNSDLPFKGRHLKKINAERDIVTENDNDNLSISPNGGGATNIIQQILNHVKYETRLINRFFLDSLNRILNPEIEFTNIITKKDGTSWEIYFEHKDNGFISLSKMGSGIKTIILTLLNLLVVPEIEKKEKKAYVFAFEELENNLHPALLRRLFAYIIDYCEKHKAYFFITTHSSIVIDIFGNYENAQIIHVTDRGDQSICTAVSSHLHNKNILKDLDIRASDLLQSNGIIWVEGPSDRVYINRWLSLIDPQLKEGIHYSILFYGGRLLSNLSFDFEWFEKELIPLLKVNHNAFVVIDRDGENEEAQLNETKQRIQQEIGEDNCWVTQGREIENYLSDTSLSNWLKKNGYDVDIKNDVNTKLGDTIAPLAPKINYDKNKRGYSTEIIEYITKDDSSVLDLNAKVGLLVIAIKDWNAIK